MTSERRVRRWPAVVLAGVFGLLGIWMFLTAEHRLGLTAGEPPAAGPSGIAHVGSCSRNWLHMWLTWTCDAEVQWKGQTVAANLRLNAVEDVSGRIPVVEREEILVTQDYPVNSDRTVFFVTMIAFGSLSVLGWFVGIRLAHLLPEPRPRGAGLPVE